MNKMPLWVVVGRTPRVRYESPLVRPRSGALLKDSLQPPLDPADGLTVVLAGDGYCQDSLPAELHISQAGALDGGLVRCRGLEGRRALALGCLGDLVPAPGA